ncbi:MAG: hypothetical protein JWO36_6971, partial [Myxococcales bacterium]|nr:hypothetical protein [Myxococcales bacterium]
MRFRTALLLGFSLVIAAILAATIGSVALILKREARHRLAEELQRAATVFEDLQTYR